MLLRVAEALNDCVNCCVAGISCESMKELGVDWNDYVEIVGDRKTAARVSRFFPPSNSDVGLIRIDAMTRKNAKIGVGDFVKVRKVDYELAEKIFVCAVKKGEVLADVSLLKKELMSKPLVKGDIIYVGMPELLKEDYKRDFLFRIFSSKDKKVFSDKILVKKIVPSGVVVVSPSTEVLVC